MPARTPCWNCHEAVMAGVVRRNPAAPARDLAVRCPGAARRYSLDQDIMRVARRFPQVHPDRFAGRPAVQRRMSLQWTATVNEAKRVLSDDLLRAGYIATGRTQPREEGGLNSAPTRGGIRPPDGGPRPDGVRSGRPRCTHNSGRPSTIRSSPGRRARARSTLSRPCWPVRYIDKAVHRAS